MTNIPVSFLHEVFDADYLNGHLFAKGKSKPLGGKGSPVGKGRVYKRIDVICPDGIRRALYVHRILVAMRTGRWPINVDHRNGDTLDNSQNNLLEADTTTNMRNRGRAKNASRYGTGVGLQEGKYWISRVGGKVECYPKDRHSLYEVQTRTLTRYYLGGYSPRHYQPLMDAIAINPEWIAIKEQLSNGDIHQ